MAVQPDVGEITYAGLVMYWVTFGILIFSAVGFAIMTFMRPFHDRKHGYMILAVVLLASGAYYSMAAQGGSVNIGRPSSRVSEITAVSTGAAGTTAGTTMRYRSIYFARYIDWFFTTPLLLLDLLLIAAVPVGIATWVVVADIFMIVTGLFGAMSSHSPRWGFFGVSCFFEACIGYALLVPGMKYAFLRGKSIGTLYAGLATLLFVSWWGYPVVWGFAEGSNYISVDAEAFAYAGLDIVSKGVFGWILCILHPIIARTEAAERKEGKYLPDLMSAPCNAPLYAIFTSGPGSSAYAPAHQHDTEMAAANGTHAKPPATSPPQVNGGPDMTVP